MFHQLVQKRLLASEAHRWNALEFLEGVCEEDGAVWTAVFEELEGVIVN